MSSLIERTTSALRGPKQIPSGPPAAPDVEAKLNAALTKLQALEQQYGEASLADVLGEDGAASRLASLMKDTDAARATVGKLKAAHGAAIQRDEQILQAQRASLYATQFRAVKANLEKRDVAAAALSAAIAEAVTHWTSLIACSEKAHAATPLQTTWPDGGVWATAELQRLVAAELYRHDGGHPMQGNKFSFPGAVVDVLDHQGQPEKITPLADTLKENTAYIIATLTGRPVS